MQNLFIIFKSLRSTKAKYIKQLCILAISVSIGLLIKYYLIKYSDVSISDVINKPGLAFIAGFSLGSIRILLEYFFLICFFLRQYTYEW